MTKLIKAVITLILVSGLFISPISFSSTTQNAQAGLNAAVEPSVPTLQISIASEPPDLDPSNASDSATIQVIEQLFIGLFDLDDETGEPIPELVKSWGVSEDGLTYNFTLRDDALWTNNEAITAGDVRYGILRSLELNGPYAYVLDLITNAYEFRNGDITNPDLVGVTVLNDTSLQISIDHQAAYLPAILALCIARPLPETTITKYGSSWTEPYNIETSGAYRLAEWTHGDHILLTKNPTYIHADAVQINQVYVHIIPDENDAWDLYQNQGLHTVDVPSDVQVDPLANPEVQQKIDGSTNYYGFTNNKPPFDDLRVRKAFAMSLDKRSLVAGNVPTGTPTGQMGPPGIWGSPELGTVGLSYNPTAARAQLQSYLDEHGMTLADFNNLGITFMHNTLERHAAIAADAQEDWYNNLGISVTVSDMEWQDYLALLNPSTPLEDIPHIWRLGWIMDYADVHNFLGPVFHNQYSSNSNRLRRGCVDDTCTSAIPQHFEELLDLADGEMNKSARAGYYSEAEQELAAVEAAYIPIYHSGIFVAAKPYLVRTYPPADYLGEHFDISEWWFDFAETAITTEGGSLASPDGSTLIEIPSGVFTDTVTLTYAAASDQPPPQFNFVNASGSFDITAIYSDTGQTASPQPGETYTLTVQLDTSTSGPIIENSFQQHYWNGEYWSPEPTSEIITNGETITIQSTPNHFSLWAVYGETNRVMLPLIKR